MFSVDFMDRAYRDLSWGSNFIQTWSLSSFWLCFPTCWFYSGKWSHSRVGRTDPNSLKWMSNTLQPLQWDRTLLPRLQFWNCWELLWSTSPQSYIKAGNGSTISPTQLQGLSMESRGFSKKTRASSAERRVDIGQPKTTDIIYSGTLISKISFSSDSMVCKFLSFSNTIDIKIFPLKTSYYF